MKNKDRNNKKKNKPPLGKEVNTLHTRKAGPHKDKRTKKQKQKDRETLLEDILEIIREN